jgi:drug/metabolite transporter (DMT)-like permease
MRRKSKAITLVIICTLFSALGQLFYKLSAASFEFNIVKLITNYNLILGLLFYFIGAILLVFALKFGQLSTVYPFISITFIWVFILGVLLLGELISPFKVLGTLTIIGGVSLIARG